MCLIGKQDSIGLASLACPLCLCCSVAVPQCFSLMMLQSQDIAVSRCSWHMSMALQNQHSHPALLMRDEQPTLGVCLSIPLLQQNQQRLHRTWWRHPYCRSMMIQVIALGSASDTVTLLCNYHRPIVAAIGAGLVQILQFALLCDL